MIAYLGGFVALESAAENLRNVAELRKPPAVLALGLLAGAVILSRLVTKTPARKLGLDGFLAAATREEAWQASLLWASFLASFALGFVTCLLVYGGAP